MSTPTIKVTDDGADAVADSVIGADQRIITISDAEGSDLEGSRDRSSSSKSHRKSRDRSKDRRSRERSTSANEEGGKDAKQDKLARQKIRSQLRHLQLVDFSESNSIINTVDLMTSHVCLTIAPTLPTSPASMQLVSLLFNHAALQILRLDIQETGRACIASTLSISLPKLRSLVWFGNGLHDILASGWRSDSGEPLPTLPRPKTTWVSTITDIVRETKKLRHLRVCQMNPPCDPENGTSLDALLDSVANGSKRWGSMRSLHLEGWGIDGYWQFVELRERAERLASAMPKLERLRVEITITDMGQLSKLFQPFKALRVLWIVFQRPDGIDFPDSDVHVAIAYLAASLPSLRLIKVQSYFNEPEFRIDSRRYAVEDDDNEASGRSVLDVTERVMEEEKECKERKIRREENKAARFARKAGLSPSSSPENRDESDDEDGEEYAVPDEWFFVEATHVQDLDPLNGYDDI